MEAIRRRAVAIRHVAFEHLGTLEPALREAGYRVEYVEAHSHASWAIRPDSADLLVVLGAPIGVGDEEMFPFLRQEKTLVAACVARGIPVIGICLGAQLLADALGARVYPGRRKEIGWMPVNASGALPEGIDAALFEDGGWVFHFHGDTFDLPAGARRFASSELTPNQGFVWRDCLALQFHLEAIPDELEAWYVGHACELAAAGLDPRALRSQARERGGSLPTRAERFWRTWLARIGGRP